MESLNSHYFCIADHVVCLRFADSEANSMQLLPSFAAFRTAPAQGDADPFFTLTVDDSLRPARKDDKQLVRKFDTGNGDTLVYLLNDGETASYYIFIQYKDGRESEHSNTASVSAN